VIDEVRTRVTDLLPKEYGKKITGEASVLQIFDIHLSGKRIKKVAGCRVTNGLVEKSKTVQVLRDDKIIFEGVHILCSPNHNLAPYAFTGLLETFKHHKTDITQAGKNMECGMALEGFEELQANDVIQCFDLFEKPKYL
jgi:translation initiation factor IF-2